MSCCDAGGVVGSLLVDVQSNGVDGDCGSRAYCFRHLLFHYNHFIKNPSSSRDNNIPTFLRMLEC